MGNLFDALEADPITRILVTLIAVGFIITAIAQAAMFIARIT